MIPKDKALELFNKNYRLFQNTDTCFGDCEEEFKKGNCTNSGHGCGIWFNLSKQVALANIDEILKSNPTIIGQMTGIKSNKKYWQKVKQELELL